ncbi:MAG: endopeptidase La, partial [Myxococcales bacterium]
MSEPKRPTIRALASEELPLLPLRNAVLFPGVVIPFDVGRPKTLALASALAAQSGRLIAVFQQKDATTEDPSADQLHTIGTVGRVRSVMRRESGVSIVVEGLIRARLNSVTETSPFLKALVSRIEITEESDEEGHALFATLRAATEELLKMLPNAGPELVGQARNISAPGLLADFVATYVESSIEERTELLATFDVKERLRGTLRLVARGIEVLKLRERINSHVKDEMSKTQREHVLRQQLKAIKDELAEGDDSDTELDQLATMIKEATLSAEARTVAEKQLRRLRNMQLGSPEYGQTRTYLDWILDMPWSETTPDTADIASVRAVLDADHHGLEKVKKRILEFLAVRKLKTDKKGPILCLVGPPGVGKTSLGRSVARALGRKFHRASLGGVHDEAAIRGHRRTYVGALPGQIIQGMKKVKTTNPVFMLDEIVKLGNDFRGDPSSALLEVLDPEQNDTFSDHYLEIPYDLSNVMFIATANVLDTVPAPLRDRMEIVEIPSYTSREKRAIARRHLIPKQLAEHGVDEVTVQIADAALDVVIEQYTREAGVRSLERQIAAMIRAVAVRVAEGESIERVIASEQDVTELLGVPKYSSEVAERTEDPGVATGLAWTPTGGDILFIEATRMPGKGVLTLTGQLGDVMKESARAALSFVRANSEQYGLEPGFLDTIDLHIHVPTGGIPKDGPSAGVTLLSALVSLLTGIRVRHDVAMTGEITLRGRVLPIGGLKEKVLAAHRAGIRRVVFPELNRHDLEEIPQDVRDDLDLVMVSTMDQVIEGALERVPVARALTVVPV